MKRAAKDKWRRSFVSFGTSTGYLVSTPTADDGLRSRRSRSSAVFWCSLLRSSLLLFGFLSVSKNHLFRCWSARDFDRIDLLDRGLWANLLGCCRSGSSPLTSSVDYETSSQLDALFWELRSPSPCFDRFGVRTQLECCVRFVNFELEDKIKCKLYYSRRSGEQVSIEG